MNVNRLAGHGLRNEGRTGVDPYANGLSNGEGWVRCECGIKSPVLENTAARKRWHRQHKDQVRVSA